MGDRRTFNYRYPALRQAASRVFLDRLMLDFTVAICTYNGAHRLPALLNCLQWQINMQDLAWEILVVDNNSSDETADVVRAFQVKWQANCTLRYEFEKQQGAGFARQRAVLMARSPLIGFLDDDNIPSMIWVAAAYRFAQTHPTAGAFGGRIRGDYEINPPPHFERIAPFLAITERGSASHRYEPQKKVLPPGAGLVVRRQAWLDHVPGKLVLSGRTEQSMLTGEDLEVVLHIQNAGWEVWYNPQMLLFHRIPQGRLKRDYLLQLCRGIGLSRYRTRMLSFRPWQQPLILPIYMLNDCLKIIRHVLKHRTDVWCDTVAACELVLYWSSLISPWFMLLRRLRTPKQGT